MQEVEQTEYARVWSILSASSYSEDRKQELKLLAAVADHPRVTFVIDTDTIAKNIQYFLDSILLTKKFLSLSKQIDNALIVSSDGFYLRDKKFSTLDEAERVINLKMFL